jgi:hypothetical protein
VQISICIIHDVASFMYARFDFKASDHLTTGCGGGNNSSSGTTAAVFSFTPFTISVALLSDKMLQPILREPRFAIELILILLI